MKKEPLFHFISLYSNSKFFSIEDYNTKRNIELKSLLSKLNFDKLDEIVTLLNLLQQNKKDKETLNMIKANIDVNNYNIKGILIRKKESLSFINKYTDKFLEGLKYDINYELFKITEEDNNKKGNKKIKYSIILSNINEDIKKLLDKYLINFNKPVLLFTNLKAKLELDKFNNYSFLFKSTYKTKVYMEKNKIDDLRNSKYHFVPTGIYIDYLKSNEFAYIQWINTQKLFSQKDNKFKDCFIKGNDFKIILDLKALLEIDTETLYIENLENGFMHCYPLEKNNINLCCFVKSIFENKKRKMMIITLENLFDLNSIILELPKNDEILDNLEINCIYLFLNFVIFIDEKMNIKLKNINEKSKTIFLYFLTDPEKYNNKKINDLFIQTNFSQLLPLITTNKIVRYLQKYIVNVEKINYINLYFSKDENEIKNYEGCIQCSDGTCSGFFYIKGKDISELKKLKININQYNIDKIDSNKTTIFPNVDDNIKNQLIIIGYPMMEGRKEISFLELYENINDLKDDRDPEKNFFKFDLLLSKNEFTVINGSFLKRSKHLEAVPIIKVMKLITLEEYIHLRELVKKDKYNNVI